MKKITRILLSLFVASTATLFVACNGDKKKLEDKEKEIAELRQLAEIDKKEMENQYAEFASQYGELKKSVKDDSLVSRLNKEQARAEALLKELQDTKANSTAEILRLKKELATVRAVLRDYIRQVDSLQQINHTLIGERDLARADADRVRMENSNIQAENSNLNQKVAIAAQLDATGIGISPLKRNGKVAKKSKDIVRFAVSFTITRNVTAHAGNRNIYVRLLKPNKQVVNESGSFKYENRSIGYSAVKTIEYAGQETHVTVYVPTNEFLGGGSYSAYIFADGQMIGSGSMSLAK